MELDNLIHEPARLLIMTLLSGVDSTDFAFLLGASGLTKGNLSSHISRLEQAGYVQAKKSFRGKIPHTEYRLTEAGRTALARYWTQLDAIRAHAQALARAKNAKAEDKQARKPSGGWRAQEG